ncbi:DUF4870 domain-containing protein [Sporosarcina sp. ACRSL]|uniref:DUF4870 domain-containing protein n=1 Tax=Sporosarcina sp. ACRSL TaxID=2918215 RepID=UPI001EF6794F|nr:DUF4870 domain-containing protein [Sporosarcina sp. ACRSL]MCG7344519.1 DUF4870 domain-containing protein [Sporosarcina sp. ACRSL]
MENTGLKVLVHASAFFAPFLVPFIIYLVVDDAEVKRLSIQALLFQLVMGALIFISAILIIFLIGIPMIIVFGLMTIIVPIMGIVKSLQGEFYNYPIVGRWF